MGRYKLTFHCTKPSKELKEIIQKIVELKDSEQAGWEAYWKSEERITKLEEDLEELKYG